MDIKITATVLQDLMNFLKETAADPVLYSILFFFYAVASAVFLPIPVEVGLLLSPATPYIWLAIVLGLGKAVGSVLVFEFGLKMGDTVRRWSTRFRVIDWIVKGMGWIVAKFRYLGLYLLLSIPLMTDTVPLYLFSLFNEKGELRLRYFALVNFLAGITRAAILYLLLTYFNINLFG